MFEGVLLRERAKLDGVVKLPLIGAWTENALYRNIWIVGNVADRPPSGWRSIRLDDRSTSVLDPKRVTLEEARLVAGLMVEFANRLRGQITLAESLDVLFECDCVHDGDAPPPWLILTTRRLRWRGSVALISALSAKARAALHRMDPSTLKYYRKFIRTMGRPMFDQPCPVAIAQTTVPPRGNANDMPLSAWDPVYCNAPLPVRASISMPSRHQKGLSFRISWKRNPSHESIPKECEFILKKMKLGPFSVDPSPFLLIYIRASGAAGDVLKESTETERAWLDQSVLATTHAIDGISQIVEIDRFGRITLTHLDEYGRSLPTKLEGGDYVRSLDLGNALFEELDYDYPIELAGISYNGGAADLMPGEDKLADLHAATPGQDDQQILRPIRNLLNSSGVFETVFLKTPNELKQNDALKQLQLMLLERLPHDMSDLRSEIEKINLTKFFSDDSLKIKEEKS